MAKKQKFPEKKKKKKNLHQSKTQPAAGKNTICYWGVTKSDVGGYITNKNNQIVTIGYCGVTNPTNSTVRPSCLCGW